MTFFLTLVFVFLVLWRPQEWLLPMLFGWPLLNFVMYPAVVTMAMEFSEGSLKAPKTPAIMLAFGLWFATLMSHVANTYFQGLMDTITETFKLCFFLVVLIVVLNSIRRLQWVILVMVLGAIMMSIHAIMQAVTGSGFADYEPIRYYTGNPVRLVQQSRFFGIFDDPNDLGQFLATCAPLVFALPKRLGFISFVLASCVVWLLAEGMLTTASRGTMVGVIAGAGCILFMWLPVRWLPYLAVIGLVVGLVMCAVGSKAMLDESARERVVYWGYANTYFKSHPIFGGGHGMFGDITGTDRAAHNAFVSCYTELGLFGYWFWFNMITLGVIGCWRTRIVFKNPRSPEQAYLKRVSGLAIVSMVGFSASAYFLSRAYIFPLFMLFALLASIPVIAQRYLPAGHPPLVDLYKDVMITGTAACLLSVAYIYATILLLNRVFGG